MLSYQNFHLFWVLLRKELSSFPLLPQLAFISHFISMPSSHGLHKNFRRPVPTFCINQHPGSLAFVLSEWVTSSMISKQWRIVFKRLRRDSRNSNKLALLFMNLAFVQVWKFTRGLETFRARIEILGLRFLLLGSAWFIPLPDIQRAFLL